MHKLSGTATLQRLQNSLSSHTARQIVNNSRKIEFINLVVLRKNVKFNYYLPSIAHTA